MTAFGGLKTDVIRALVVAEQYFADARRFMPTSVRRRAHEVAVGVIKFSLNSGPMYLLSVECGV